MCVLDNQTLWYMQDDTRCSRSPTGHQFFPPHAPCAPRVILVLCRRKDRVLTRCSECGRAFYCSEMCQELGRPLHWRECIVFRHRPNYRPKDFARFLARLIWVLKVRGLGGRETLLAGDLTNYLFHLKVTSR